MAARSSWFDPRRGHRKSVAGVAPRIARCTDRRHLRLVVSPMESKPGGGPGTASKAARGPQGPGDRALCSPLPVVCELQRRTRGLLIPEGWKPRLVRSQDTPLRRRGPIPGGLNPGSEVGEIPTGVPWSVRCNGADSGWKPAGAHVPPGSIPGRSVPRTFNARSQTPRQTSVIRRKGGRHRGLVRRTTHGWPSG